MIFFLNGILVGVVVMFFLLFLYKDGRSNRLNPFKRQLRLGDKSDREIADLLLIVLREMDGLSPEAAIVGEAIDRIIRKRTVRDYDIDTGCDNIVTR